MGRVRRGISPQLLVRLGWTSLLVPTGLLVALFVCTGAARADISVHATVSPRRTQVGEAIALTIEVDGVQNATAPALGQLDGFDAQYVGPSTQISIVNGQMNASIQHRYSLMPLRPGHFTLGPFVVEYQGQQYRTAAVEVDVGGTGQPPAAAAPAPRARRQAQQAPGARARSAAGDALRLELSAPRREVYLHEQIPVDVTLYVGAIQVADLQYPTLTGDGFSIDKFPEPTQRQQTIDGRTFRLVHFHTTIVPLRTSELSLAATLRLNVLSRRRSGLNDPFFDQFFQGGFFGTERRPMDVRSDPLTLHVLPLPNDGKPADFSGAVGRFTLDVTAAPTQLNAGDPITLRMNLHGTGSLTDANPPFVTNTQNFRTYDARPAKADGALKAFEQVLIPNDARVHAIPPVRFSFFDPRARQYRTVQSQPIALVVRPPQQAPRAEVVSGVPGGHAGAPETLGRDIVYIKDDPGRLVQRGRPWYHSVAFLLWQPVPIMLFGTAVWYERRRRRLSGDVRYARFTRAGKAARRGLAAAETALAGGNRDAFYDAVSRTMQEYLGAKLDLPPGAIDAEAAVTGGLSADAVDRIRNFFVTCEQVRFAPGSGDGDMRGTLALAREIVRRLERERRLLPGTRAAILPALLVLASLAAPASAADSTPPSPQTTFFHANALYKDAQYNAAAREYEELLHSGLESGPVYFNLGNAYFKAGERGKAILNYERARRFMPRDPDLEANLAYARSLTGADACVPVFWQRLVFPLADRMNSSRLVWVASIVYTLMLLTLAGYWLWPRRPRWLVYVTTSLGVLLIVAVTSLGRQVLANDWQDRAVVVSAGGTSARFEPADNGTVHFVLKEGTSVRILDTRQGWLQVARCDGRRGWIPKTTVEAL